MARIEINVKMKNIYTYEAPSYGGYGYDTHRIYTMTGEDGKTYVWKTTTSFGYKRYIEDARSVLACDFDDDNRPYVWEPINKDDELRIKASVKCESEYRGEPQTEINRVSLIERTFKAKTREEIEAEREAEREARAREQRASIAEGDLIWRMPYKQYKEHYADCETIANSYKNEGGYKTIEVIIRDGRLKASGVRGEHYSGYEISYQKDGETWRTVYRAVSEDNALRRFRKEHEGIEGECTHIYQYGNYHRWF